MAAEISTRGRRAQQLLRLPLTLIFVVAVEIGAAAAQGPAYSLLNEAELQAAGLHLPAGIPTLDAMDAWFRGSYHPSSEGGWFVTLHWNAYPGYSGKHPRAELLKVPVSGDISVIDISRKWTNRSLPVIFGRNRQLCANCFLLVAVTKDSEVWSYTTLDPLDSGGDMDVPPDPRYRNSPAANVHIPVMRAAESTFVISLPDNLGIAKLLLFNLAWHNTADGKTEWRLEPVGAVKLPVQAGQE